MNTYFIDTETVGFHGVPVTIQWADGDGPVNLHHIWLHPMGETVDLIERFVDGLVVFHNARFDWFHLSKIYHMFSSAMSKYGDVLPLNLDLAFWADAEFESQNGPCLKPRACVDTLLLASRCDQQSYLMNSKPVWIRRVPVGLAEPLRALLESRSQGLPWIMFAKRAKPDSPRWGISDCKDENGNIDLSFKDLKLSFSPSKTLKHLAAYLCGHNVKHKFEDIAYAKSPAEEGYAPFVKLLTDASRDWLYDGEPTWPVLLRDHVAHWSDDANAQEYALDDITMLRKLYEYFGSPEEDQDSLLACQVASVRLRGFSVDLEGVRERMSESLKIVHTAKLNVNSPKQVVGYVAEALDSMEQFILADGCDQKVIDEIKQECTLDERETCPCVEEDEESIFEDGEDIDSIETSITRVDGVCQRCGGTGYVGPGPMPVVERVEHIELVRRHKKRIELFDKLLLAKRAYPDFNVIGTKSGRMSGAGGLNFHGVDHSEEVRSLFTLADPGMVLSAGDYSSQELAIAATTMNDDDLMHDMESGKSLHGMFAAELFDTTYEDIMETKDERYGKGKSAVYLTLYGGTFETLARNCGVEVKVAERAYNKMVQKYPQMGSTRKAITMKFAALTTGPDGHSQFKQPKEKFINSIFGFKRHFDAEYEVQKIVWDTMNSLPEEWRNLTLKVQRDRRNRERMQTITSAILSAMYGACHSIQNQIIRASNNHVIQSTGRELTVGMQAHVWSLQPQGIHPFKLWLMSIHDELAVVSPENMVEPVRQAVIEKVEEQRKMVPLTSIEWFTNNESWAEKGSGHNATVIGWSHE